MQLTPRDKRMLQVLGVVAGLALIYLLFTTVLGGDDGGEIAEPTGPTGPAPTVTATVTPSPTPRETLPPVVLAGARDPFSIPPGLAPSGSVSPSPTGTVSPTTTVTTTPTVTTSPTTPPVTTTPTVTTSPTTPPTTTTTPPPDEGPDDHITIGGHDVRLVSIFNNRKKAQVEVDGDVYTVEVGAVFDDNFKLVKIEDRCARFLFGDQSFTLCERPRK